MSDTEKTPERLGGFELGKPLGRGGMGVVYRARQVELDRWVALKILPPEFQVQAEFANRFKAEARAAAKLDHPNLVRVYEAGEAGGKNFFAMELVEGKSCEARLREVGSYGEHETVDIGLSVANALAYAWNEARLIHRDIKPDNILIRGKDKQVKVADMGLAKQMTEVKEGSAFTQPGMVVGTLHYISPEQAQGRPDIDFRTDMYSLGATLYQLLTGKPPFHGDNSMGLLVKHITEPFPDLAAQRPDVSGGFLAVIDKMVAKDRNDRYASWELLIQDFEAVSKGMPPPTLNMPAWAMSPAGGEAASAGAATSATSGSDNKTIGLIIGGCIAFALVIWFVFSSLSSSDKKNGASNTNSGGSGSSIDFTSSSGAQVVGVDPASPEWIAELNKGSLVPLFNGKNFAGWSEGHKKGWEVQAGMMIVQTTDIPRNIERDLPINDFELSWQMRLVGDSNAGVDFRSIKGKLYTLQLKSGDYVQLHRWQSGVLKPDILAGPTKLTPGWHFFRLIARGDSFAVECDGGPVLRAENVPPFGQSLSFFCIKGGAEFKQLTVRSLEAAVPAQ